MILKTAAWTAFIGAYVNALLDKSNGVPTVERRLTFITLLLGALFFAVMSVAHKPTKGA